MFDFSVARRGALFVGLGALLPSSVQTVIGTTPDGLTHSVIEQAYEEKLLRPKFSAFCGGLIQALSKVPSGRTY